MQTEEIRLTVPADVARRFREATPEEQERVRAAVAHAFMSREERIEELKRRMDRMAETARERGLTSEKLDELLRDDD